MTCPGCSGTGYVTKRFLWIFTRDALCEKCRGTGEFPPGPVRRIRDARFDDSYYRDRDRDHDIAASVPIVSASSHDRDDTFTVGDGGRSGGAGGGAAWDEGGGPVIADPFGDDASSGAVAASAAEADDTATSGDSDTSAAGDPSY